MIDWEYSFVVWLYKDKGGDLDRGSYGGLKLTKQLGLLAGAVIDINILMNQ